MTQKIIFDCDNTMGLPLKEVDDGLTLLYLLGVPEIEILGITTTFGNGTIEQVQTRTTKLVEALLINPPVLQGEGWRGQPPDTQAAQFLVEMVQKYPHEITLLATGPLGNLGAAAQLDPDFYSKVQEVVAMGGYLEPLRLGYRNLPELNLSANPEAALGLLGAPCPVTLMPAQACLDAPFTLRHIRQADWWSRRMKQLLRSWLVAFGLYCGVTEFYLWDLLPAVYLTRPELFEVQTFPIRKEPTLLEKGILERDETPSTHAISIATKIKDQAAFYQELERGWRRTAEDHPPFC